MTHYITRVSDGVYKITFETDRKEYYEAVQEACRIIIDETVKNHEGTILPAIKGEK